MVLTSLYRVNYSATTMSLCFFQIYSPHRLISYS